MSDATDKLIILISQFGKIIGENLLKEFLERYGLPNLARATIGQLQEFYDYCTKP